MKTSPELSSPSLAIEPTTKGSHRSMWELLLQLRVLLPYLSRLLPLLDHGMKSSPDLTGLTQGVADIQRDSRDLTVQARNQALQLERVEQQLARLRTAHENSLEESRRMSNELRALRQRLLGMFLVTLALLIVTLSLVALLWFHS